MDGWKSILKADPMVWLLGEDNPSVRYFALRDILMRPEDDPELSDAKAAVMLNGTVPKILAKMDAEEYKKTYRSFYRDKYKGLVWQLVILAEHGAERAPEIASFCEYILSNSQERETGGFSIDGSAKGAGGLPSGVIPCLTGNMVYSLIRFGYLDDERVQKAIGWIVQYQRFDDGDGAPAGGFYDRSEACWGRHTCHMGVFKALKALAEIPPEKRTGDIGRTIQAGVEYILRHHIFKKSHDLTQVAKPGWLRLGFPLMYQDDVLEGLEILLKLGVHDSRMQEAVDVILSKQDGEGKWKLESTFNDRFLVGIEKKGLPSKWVTMKALRVLKQWQG
jgi:hypothetical protein